MKAKIFNTSANAAKSISDVGTALGIPQPGTDKYADVMEIINPESSYEGKFTFPILTEGTWKCDQLFTPSDLVDWDDDWFYSGEPPE
jgi:hypothetical protein